MVMKTLSPKDNLSSLSPEAVIRKPDVLQLIPVSSSTWDNGVKSGKFPPPIRLSTRAVGWRLGDIFQWIEDNREGGAA